MGQKQTSNNPPPPDKVKEDIHNDSKANEQQITDNQSIELQLSSQQIISLINDGIIDTLGEKASYELTEYKWKIIDYFKQKEIDNNQYMIKMERKTFLKDMATYLQNDKLKESLEHLYAAIMKHDQLNMSKTKHQSYIPETKPTEHKNELECDCHVSECQSTRRILDVLNYYSTLKA
eukprot:187088_1